MPRREKRPPRAGRVAVLNQLRLMGVAICGGDARDKSLQERKGHALSKTLHAGNSIVYWLHGIARPLSFRLYARPCGGIVLGLDARPAGGTNKDAGLPKSICLALGGGGLVEAVGADDSWIKWLA